MTLEDLEARLREAKEAYRDDKTDENKQAFHDARDALHEARRETRVGRTALLNGDTFVTGI